MKLMRISKARGSTSWIFQGYFLCFFLTWMLINRPLSSANGPSSIALNTGLLDKDTILMQLQGS